MLKATQILKLEYFSALTYVRKQDIEGLTPVQVARRLAHHVSHFVSERFGEEITVNSPLQTLITTHYLVNTDEYFWCIVQIKSVCGDDEMLVFECIKEGPIKVHVFKNHQLVCVQKYDKALEPLEPFVL
jgi:hypothetical protein